jgi:hypothetical protein
VDDLPMCINTTLGELSGKFQAWIISGTIASIDHVILVCSSGFRLRQTFHQTEGASIRSSINGPIFPNEQNFNLDFDFDFDQTNISH